MKRSLPIFIVLTIIGCIGAVLYFTFSAKSAQRLVNLALKKNDQTFVFSKLGTTLTQLEIDQDKSPSVFPFLPILVDKKEVYIEPRNMKELCQLLEGSYTLHDYPETSYDGYVTTEGSALFQLDQKNQSTDKVGEQLQVSTVTLKNKAGETMEVTWSQKQMSTKMEALQNCQLKSFMIITNPHPGETVGSAKKFVVVNIQDLARFFHPELRVAYNADEQLLYVME